ncbi:hypothetical protein H6F74_19355 [Trichocoleus sp. FACHB-90]|uniref:hypothetical protein n=1 Tax=Cyanophyceae TaxID=3028117 RepID=UPI001684F9A1|nr:hypothetical protein [Trichocoleus sp. FACHB-90]MBD1928388.1 hypothetical protein [Trichocoleus sp. FACHB-90]
MINKLSLVVLLALSLAACTSTPQSNQSAIANSPTAELPDVQCQGEVPQPVKASLGEFRLAQEADFIPAIRQFQASGNSKQKLTCSIFSADFNQDGLKDYAMLLVSEELGDFRFQMSLNQGDGKFQRDFVKDYKRITKPEAGVIYTSMDFKPAGEKGLAARDYSPLKPGSPEQKTYVEKPAIELWKGSQTDAPPKQLDISSLGYCSEALYFVDGKKTFVVCD